MRDSELPCATSTRRANGARAVLPDVAAAVAAAAAVAHVAARASCARW